MTSRKRASCSQPRGCPQKLRSRTYSLPEVRMPSADLLWYVVGATSSNRSIPIEALLLHQSVKIHSAVVIRYVDLTSINHRRIKFVEQELDTEALRVPENLE